LPKGVSLNGKPQENGELPLISFQHSDGIGVNANNSVKNLNIDTPVNHKAIFNTTVKQDLGTFTFENLLVKGQVSIITRVGATATQHRTQRLNAAITLIYQNTSKLQDKKMGQAFLF